MKLQFPIGNYNKTENIGKKQANKMILMDN